MYDNLYIGASRRPNAYGGGVLAVPHKVYLTWGKELELKKPSGRQIWIFPAPFCPSRIITYTRYNTDEVRPATVE